MIELSWSGRLGLSTAFVLLTAVSACDCYRHYEYVSFEGQPDFHVVERTFWPRGWTLWPVPNTYVMERPQYRIELSLSNVLLGFSPSRSMIEAFDLEGEHLEISRFLHAPRMPEVTEEGNLSFDVLRDGEKIGSETLHYEIRSRPFACEWDLP